MALLRRILFAFYGAKFAHHPEGSGYSADGDLLLLAAADFDSGSGNDFYRCQRDGLV